MDYIKLLELVMKPCQHIDNEFQRRKIDKTLFIRRNKSDILLVQVYVDDIIFGSTKKELCIEFEKLMHEKFQMSSIGELTFFLGLQVKQKKDGIFISQDKYVSEILKKFRFTEVKTASTPLETQKPLLKDEDGEEVDVHMYRSMIGSLMYLTSSRSDIMFVVCACARYQVNPKVLSSFIWKRIFSDYAVSKAWIEILQQEKSFRDAKGVDCLPNSTIFEQLTLMGSKTIAWNEFSSTMASAIICLATNQKFNFLKYIFESMVKNLDNVSGKFLMYPRSRRSKRKDTEVPQPSGPTINIADEAVNEEMDNSLERAATTATGLEAESENVSKLSNDPLLARGNTLQSGEDRLKLEELMELCISLQSRVLALETTKTTQAIEITSKEDASKQGRIADIDANEDIYLVNVQTDEDMFVINDLDSDEVIVESLDVVNTAEETRNVVEEVTAITIPVSAATTTTTTTAITDIEMTLAQALAELKSAKPKADKL
ncbi:putative ribonuclease H-like domain-containing protein [Tanacetum coccineum]